MSSKTSSLLCPRNHPNDKKCNPSQDQRPSIPASRLKTEQNHNILPLKAILSRI